MAQVTRRKFRILLDMSLVDDKWRHDNVAGILDVSATSSLIVDPAVQACVTAVTTTSVALKAKNDVVAADRARMALSLEEETQARTGFDNALLTLRAMVENKATSATDVVSMGFKERGAAPPRGQLLPPDVIDIRLPSKARGQFTASVREIGRASGGYAAEWSPDPIGDNTWSPLVGYTKTRIVTGPSGTKVWVRFARIRRHVRSDWGKPVLVTIP